MSYQTLKNLICIILISVIFISCKSKEEKKKEELKQASKELIIKATTKLEMKKAISTDSTIAILKHYVDITRESPDLGMVYAKKLDSISKLSLSALIPKKSDTEYIDYFQSKYDQIKLEKLFGQAPLYGEYADKLATFIQEVYETDQSYQILGIKKVDELYQKAKKANKAALVNYGKYGELDKNPVVITSICQAALQSQLNDPDFEVVRENYFLKQTTDGYKYKLTIRAKNHFGAKILKEITFNLKYNAAEKNHYVSSIQE